MNKSLLATILILTQSTITHSSPAKEGNTPPPSQNSTTHSSPQQSIFNQSLDITSEDLAIEENYKAITEAVDAIDDETCILVDLAELKRKTARKVRCLKCILI